MSAEGRAVATWLSSCAIWVAEAGRGQPWDPPSILGELPPSAPANWLWEPTLAVNGPGVALVAWATQEPPTPGRQLLSRRLDPAAGWTAKERIDGGEAGHLANDAASLALDDAGNGLAVWASESVVAVYLSAASGWQAPERIGLPNSVPRAHMHSAGWGFATWVLSGEAVVRHFEPEQGWTDTSRFQPDSGWRFVGSGKLAFGAREQALLVWTQSRSKFGPTAVWSAAFSGGRWSPLGTISATGLNSGSPQVGIDSAGRGLGVWQEEGTGLVFAHFDNGVWGASQAIPGTHDARDVDMDVSAGGDAIVAWWALDSATGRGRIWASRYSTGTWWPAEPLQVSSNQPNPPAVSVDACGNAVVIWSEFENGQIRIWANRYDAGCR